MIESPRPLFRSTGQKGYSGAVRALPGGVRARKRVCELEVQFATSAGAVQTPEGAVRTAPGDAILTGSLGERWCVPRIHFADKYHPVPPTRPGSPGRYLSVPIDVLAVPMKESFEVLLLDGVSRLVGGAGDWLVDYGDGSLGVVARRIFATTYDILG